MQRLCSSIDPPPSFTYHTLLHDPPSQRHPPLFSTFLNNPFQHLLRHPFIHKPLYRTYLDPPPRKSISALLSLQITLPCFTHSSSSYRTFMIYILPLYLFKPLPFLSPPPLVSFHPAHYSFISHIYYLFKITKKSSTFYLSFNFQVTKTYHNLNMSPDFFNASCGF